MLQMVSDEGHFEDGRKQDATLQLWGIGLQIAGEDALVMHEEKHVLFDEENHSNSFNDSDEDMEELVNDEQEKLFLHINTRLLEDLMDNGL